MVDQLKFPSADELPVPNKPVNRYSTGELTGKIADHIGTGKNAKDSFIWMTITWSFYIATSLSVLIFVRSLFITTESADVLSSMVEIWSIFVPIITLALGYAFGKGE